MYDECKCIGKIKSLVHNTVKARLRRFYGNSSCSLVSLVSFAKTTQGRQPKGIYIHTLNYLHFSLLQKLHLTSNECASDIDPATANLILLPYFRFL